MELKRAAAKSDYLGGLAELLPVLLLHLHQPGVTLQQGGGREREREGCV